METPQTSKADILAGDNADDREAAPAALAADSTSRRAVLKHRRGSRWMHWINFPLLTIMIWSGLRIYWADRQGQIGIGIGAWHWFDLFPDSVNDALGLERRLARGLAFHLTFGWLFAINGALYALYTLFTKEWRNLVPRKGWLRDSIGVVLHDLYLRKNAPEHEGSYNAAQRLTYSIILVSGLFSLLTGFAIYKPTQLSLLTSAFGGYEAARLIHFWITIGFMAFFVIHILQVARAGFGNFWSMVTGYQLEPRGGSATSLANLSDEPVDPDQALDSDPTTKEVSHV